MSEPAGIERDHWWLDADTDPGDTPPTGNER